MFFLGKKNKENLQEEAYDSEQEEKYEEYEREVKLKKEQYELENEEIRKQEQIKERKAVEGLAKSNVPLLILDKNWHYMFPAGKKSKKMLALEKKLNDLLKEQGRLTNDTQGYKKLKKDCINQIMGLMGSESSQEDLDDMLKPKKYIQQSNQKLEEIEQRLEEIPKEMKKVNQELLEESIRLIYEEMKENKFKEKIISREIKELEEKLRDKKEEKEVKRQMIDRAYKFLHSIAGADVLNKWDSKYKD